MQLSALSAANATTSLMGGLIQEVLGKSTEMLMQQSAEMAKMNLQASIDAQAAASVEGLGELLDVVG